MLSTSPPSSTDLEIWIFAISIPFSKKTGWSDVFLTWTATHFLIILVFPAKTFKTGFSAFSSISMAIKSLLWKLVFLILSNAGILSGIILFSCGSKTIAAIEMPLTTDDGRKWASIGSFLFRTFSPLELYS